MKKFFSFISLLILSVTGFSQTNLFIRGDTINLRREGRNAVTLIDSSALVSKLLVVGAPKGNINTYKNNSHLVLGDSATTKGLIIPRVQSTAAITDPKQGMIVYSISDSSFRFRRLNSWVKLDSTGAGENTIEPDVVTLRASDVANRKGIILQGITAANDGNGGEYYWDGGSVAADDGITVIKPTGYIEGAWLKVFKGKTRAAEFNITGSAGSQTTKLLAMIANATVRELIFDEPGSLVAFNGKIDFLGKTIRAENGAQLVSDGGSNDTIKNAHIIADYQKQVFGTTVTVDDLTNFEVPITWLGAVANGSFDNYPILVKALEALLGHDAGGAANFGKIIIPRSSGIYYCSKKWLINRMIELCGSGGAQGSRLQFAVDSGGIRVTAEGLTKVHIHDLTLIGTATKFLDASHGLEINTTETRVERVVITGFAGNGLQTYGSVANTPPSNANLCRYTDITVENCRGSGIHTVGQDANAITFQNINATQNHHYGFWDQSFLGNTYINCHVASSGQQDTTVAVQNPNGGAGFYAAKLNNVGVRPGVTVGWQDYWEFWPSGATWPTPAVTWDTARQYYGSGSYASVDPNARTVYYNCYNENDMNGYYIVPPAMIYNGFWQITDLLASSVSPLRTIFTGGAGSGLGIVHSQLSVYTDNSTDGILTQYNKTNGGFLNRLITGGTIDGTGLNIFGLNNQAEYAVGISTNFSMPALAVTKSSYVKAHGRLSTIGDYKLLFDTSGFFLKNYSYPAEAMQFRVANSVADLGGNHLHGDITFNGSSGSANVFGWRRNLIAGGFDTVFTGGHVPQYATGSLPSGSLPNVVYDNTTGTYKANFNGTWTAISTAAAGLTGSGVSGQVAFWNGTTSLASDATLAWDNGISQLQLDNGTTTNGNAVFKNSSGAGYAGFSFINSSSDYAATITYSNASAGFYPADFWVGPRTAAGKFRFIAGVDLNTKMMFDPSVDEFYVNTTSDAGNYKLQVNGNGYVNGTITATSIPAATSDVDKYLVSDGGIIKFRTGEELLSDVAVPGTFQTATVQTVDATPTTIQTITTTAGEGAVLEVTLSGIQSAGDDVITGKKIVRFKKSSGSTLTIGSITDVLATVADGAISTASWTITNSGTNVIIQVTGVAATTIEWKVQWIKTNILAAL